MARIWNAPSREPRHLQDAQRLVVERNGPGHLQDVGRAIDHQVRVRRIFPSRHATAAPTGPYPTTSTSTRVQIEVILHPATPTLVRPPWYLRRFAAKSH